jgi:hypothetical protein
LPACPGVSVFGCIMVSWAVFWACRPPRRSSARHERIFSGCEALGGQKSAATAAAECPVQDIFGPAEKLR